MEIAISLLQHYSFDLGGYTIKDLIRAWSSFKPEWVRQAVIESLFQGRYKAVSVNQILHLWERKGEPNCRYNHEFERLVCGDVAVIYEDRIFYTPPRTATREAEIAEIPAFSTIAESNSPLPFPRRPMLGTAKITQSMTQVNPVAQPKPQRYPSRLTTPSGTTAAAKVYPSTSNTEYSKVYQSAYENMTLLAESSMFVDKLRAMCSDHLVLPIPEISSELGKVEAPIEN
ncbi:MAG: hypothetical protein IM585_04910 [Pseudanabaena sp. M135S2SP2A07QC]|nr:hypothetical protein [Pseudanabaena sp. M090S1SP2A07QC]MCA6507452.1 hypothetical protein [Pseudanabaena sp. M172S2SP2A07QC]MCA6523669.1 hypothetical protein [Pseudanabaena sp. M051S1SP2A07QC]MCA6531147.1 hypothetical protein [Pseudanabaena sp. M125S2SP2A07QC]MCA6534667.1 hypothetical protein [Pseudanabaena sp. M176S2SP2A07QC]MCA6539015.1 hypothetical protein [Pseudanabaena sp. M037S2SP2A07QC]MCA6543297.1 hypothetical protein [Pseudanabaena sp. M074S1SP2A07QC]MCA6549488.1 hypothetical prot